MKIILTLLAGGLLTSTAEYVFKYNLVDYILDGVKFIKSLFTKGEAEVQTLEAEVKDKL